MDLNYIFELECEKEKIMNGKSWLNFIFEFFDDVQKGKEFADLKTIYLTSMLHKKHFFFIIFQLLNVRKMIKK